MGSKSSVLVPGTPAAPKCRSDTISSVAAWNLVLGDELRMPLAHGASFPKELIEIVRSYVSRPGFEDILLCQNWFVGPVLNSIPRSIVRDEWIWSFRWDRERMPPRPPPAILTASAMDRGARDAKRVGVDPASGLPLYYEYSDGEENASRFWIISFRDEITDRIEEPNPAPRRKYEFDGEVDNSAECDAYVEDPTSLPVIAYKHSREVISLMWDRMRELCLSHGGNGDSKGNPRVVRVMTRESIHGVYDRIPHHFWVLPPNDDPTVAPLHLVFGMKPVPKNY